MRFRLHCPQGRRNHRQGRSLRSLVMCPSFLLFPESTAQAAMESTRFGQNHPTWPASIRGTPEVDLQLKHPALVTPRCCHGTYENRKGYRSASGCFLRFYWCLPVPAACQHMRHPPSSGHYRTPAQCSDRVTVHTAGPSRSPRVRARRGDCASGMRRHGVRKRESPSAPPAQVLRSGQVRSGLLLGRSLGPGDGP
jgi:hypothetical protein